MKPSTWWDLELQESTCRRATETGDGTCNRVVPPLTLRKIVPGEKFLRVETPDGQVMGYHPECLSAGLLDEG